MLSSEILGYSLSILKGAVLTVEVALLSLVISTVIGISGALAKKSNNRLLRYVLFLYTTIIRGIPELVLMLLIFFGGQIALNNLIFALGYDTYIDVNPFFTGVLTIGFIYGAYMIETFRGAIQAIEHEQIETAYAFGMNKWQVTRKIIFPQMALHALPSYTNNWLVLLKSTALVSVIGLNDMVRIANLASGSIKEPFIFYLFVCLIFLGFTAISLWGLKRICLHYNIDTEKVLKS